MEKYYIPEIEEFHVGFEYELVPSVGISIFNFGNPEENTEVIWATHYKKGIYGVIDVEPFGGALASIRSGIESGKCRVKCLSREDFEDLGFVITREEIKSYGSYLEGYIKEDPRGWTTELWASFLPKNDYMNVCLKTSHFNGNIRVHLKNKSELRKLLKQNNII